MGEAKWLTTLDEAVEGGGESEWGAEQSELVGAIINAARRRGVSSRRLRLYSRPIAARGGKGSDLEQLVPVLRADAYVRAGRLAMSVAEELRRRCGGLQDVAVFLKRSMSLPSLAGAIRARSLW